MLEVQNKIISMIRQLDFTDTVHSLIKHVGTYDEYLIIQELEYIYDGEIKEIARQLDLKLEDVDYKIEFEEVMMQEILTTVISYDRYHDMHFLDMAASNSDYSTVIRLIEQYGIDINTVRNSINYYIAQNNRNLDKLVNLLEVRG